MHIIHHLMHIFIRNEVVDNFFLTSVIVGTVRLINIINTIHTAFLHKKSTCEGVCILNKFVL